MTGISKVWNPKQALLRKYLSDDERFGDAITLCLELHSLVHSSSISERKTASYEDLLLEGLTEEIFRTKSQKGNETIAWNIWHITRIEDMTAGILIADKGQVFNKTVMTKSAAGITDTGNAMSADEIRTFSSRIKMKELLKYRNDVGIATRKIIKRLKPEDLKRKIRQDQLQRIAIEGGVLPREESSWLLDFWGRKNVAGILLMPVTRHQIVHINSSLDIKERFLNKRNA